MTTLPRMVRSFATLAFTLMPAMAGAQAPAIHRHYEKPSGYDQAVAPGQPLAPRLQKLGAHTFPVTTSRPRAQLFINQGLNLAYGFNHAEAGRAFAEAARLDPQLRDGVLGPGARARPEHQRHHECRKTNRRRSSWCRRRVALKRQATRARSARTSTRSRPATPATLRIAAKADRALRRRDAQADACLSRRISMRRRCSPSR